MADAIPWLLVGLGNPGPKYAGHRHNAGAMVVDSFREKFGTPGACQWREKFHSRFVTVTGDFGRCVVIFPQTYMNNSGKAVVAASSFYNVPPKRIVVVHDEVDFEFARLAVKNGGGHGGHNGLRDIVDLLGSRDFIRVRVGVGRPPRGDQEVSGWLLSNFSAEDAAELPDLIERAREAATAVLTDGVAAAMNEFNRARPAPEPPHTADPTPAQGGEGSD